MRNESIGEAPLYKNILRLVRLPWEHLVPLIYFAAMFLYYPYHSVFENDPDEGINLIKALMFNRGYPLYRSIWSDQPPIFTYFLAWAFKLFGHDVNVGRALILAFSALLVWGMVVYLRRVWGGWQALIAVVLVVLLPYFPMLSTAILIGLPAISLAVLSLAAMVIWHQSGRRFWLVCSAVACSLSIYIKLFTVILAPILVAGLLIEAYVAYRQHPGSWKPWLPVVIWAGIFGGLAIGFGFLLVGVGNFEQLILPHLTSGDKLLFGQVISSLSIDSYLSESRPLLWLTLVGVLMALWQRRWLVFYPASWMVAAYLLLKWNTPVWYHHQLLITVPAVMVASGAAGEVLGLPLKFLRQRHFSLLGFGLWLPAIILTVMILSSRLPVVIPEFTRSPYFIMQADYDPPKELRIVREIDRRSSQGDWMVTDLPMYAFRTGLSVPPELAVFSNKRRYAGGLSEPYLLEIINRYNPKFILWGRFHFPELNATLSERYRQVYAFRGKVLYQRND